MLDLIEGSPAAGKSVAGNINLFVDDLFGTSGTKMEQRVPARLKKDVRVDSEDWNDVLFYRTKNSLDERSSNRTKHSSQSTKGDCRIGGHPNRKEHEGRSPLYSYNAYKVQKLLGQINWLQNRTQFQCCYNFSRCASSAASPTVGDVKACKKLVRQLKLQPVKLHFWPLTGPLRIIGFLDASHRNNEDGS